MDSYGEQVNTQTDRQQTHALVIYMDYYANGQFSLYSFWFCLRVYLQPCTKSPPCCFCVDYQFIYILLSCVNMYTALSKLCHQVIPQLLFNCRFFYFLKCNNTSCGGFENKRQILRRPSGIWPTRTFRRRGFCRTRVDCSRSWTPSARNLKWTECDWGIWTTRPSRARMPDTDGISIRDSLSPIESVSLPVYRTL